MTLPSIEKPKLSAADLKEAMQLGEEVVAMIEEQEGNKGETKDNDSDSARIDIDKIPMPETANAKKSFLERIEEGVESVEEELRGFDDSFDLSADYVVKEFSTAVTSDFAAAKTAFNEICAIIDGDKTEEEKSDSITFAQSKTNDSALQLFVAISRVVNNPELLTRLRTEFAFLDSDESRDKEKSAALILAALKSFVTDEKIIQDEKDLIGEIFANLFESNFKSLEEKHVDKEDMESLLSEKDGELLTSEAVIAPEEDVKVGPSGNASSKVDLDVESGVEAEDLLKNKKAEEESKKKTEEESKKKNDASTDSPEEKKKKKTLVEPEKSLWQSIKDQMTEGEKWSKDVATNKIPRAAVSVIVGDAIAVGAFANFIPALAAGPVGLAVAFLIWEMTKSDEKNKAKAPAPVVVKDELAEYEKQRKEIESRLFNPIAPTTEAGKAATAAASETVVDSSKKKDELGVIKNAVKGADAETPEGLDKSTLELIKAGFMDVDPKAPYNSETVATFTKNGNRGRV
ncbi:MAG: hypothetical protein KA100_05800 [Rickettsiales bacterium]|nr:hypothetical protein [Rickettsiales bacterium]